MTTKWKTSCGAERRKPSRGGDGKRCRGRPGRAGTAIALGVRLALIPEVPHFRFWRSALLVLIFGGWIAAAADVPAGRVPPVGIALSESERTELQKGLTALGEAVESLRSTAPAGLLPDVEIFHRAVAVALRYDEIYRTNEVASARILLQHGLQRAQELREGRPSWLTATGLVVRGFRSKLDGSVQPYGLVVPSTWAETPQHPRRLDVWLHGRDDRLTELKFLAERERSAGEFTPPDTLVLHPYGRYCNAFKFAGETDVFEALAQVQQSYRIDRQRIVLRGFSMGGAGTWHLAAHHPDVWAVAAPGAGFAETAEYLKIFRQGTPPPVLEQRLWQLYDATDYAANFRNLPVIAYNGTLDEQKQAADVMARALQEAGLKLPRVWGTNVGHKYTPEGKQAINRFVDDVVAQPKELLPRKVHFTTRTLRYSRGVGVEVLGLMEHWKRADLVVDRDLHSVQTTNISAFAVEDPGAGRWEVDGQTLSLAATPVARDGTTGRLEFRRTAAGVWSVGADVPEAPGGRKTPGLQGPVDDAFMDSFLMVRPTGPVLNQEVGAWIAARLAKATNDWRAQFRGDVRIKDDVEVTEADVAQYNLILWGDPQSNRWMARLKGRWPLGWDAQAVTVGARVFGSARHVPVFICPNPLNPRRYVVLNNGFTFADVLPASNAQQTPKLPDYAVFEVTRGDTAILAEFFDETWKVR